MNFKTALSVSEDYKQFIKKWNGFPKNTKKEIKKRKDKRLYKGKVNNLCQRHILFKKQKLEYNMRLIRKSKAIGQGLILIYLINLLAKLLIPQQRPITQCHHTITWSWLNSQTYNIGKSIQLINFLSILKEILTCFTQNAIKILLDNRFFTERPSSISS